jgi:hypothetical protein
MLNFLGIQTDQLQHYPYVRQWDGPAVHLDRATFDCSPANYRNFWHVLKLRHALHARLAAAGTGPAQRGTAPAPPPLDTVVLMDRNECDRSKPPPKPPPPTASTGRGGENAGRANQSSLATPHRGAPSHHHDKCKKGRGVKHHHLIRRALEARFEKRDLRVVDFTGTEPWEEQAALFHRAAVVVGPHGAQVANIIFCQRRAAVIEFVASRRTNSALYAGYAHAVFGLDYWAVVSNSSNGSYDDITPDDTVHTVEMALERQEARRLEQRRGRGGGGGGGEGGGDGAVRAQRTGSWQVLQGDTESNLVSGYGNYNKGWPTGW